MDTTILFVREFGLQIVLVIASIVVAIGTLTFKQMKDHKRSALVLFLAASIPLAVELAFFFYQENRTNYLVNARFNEHDDKPLYDGVEAHAGILATLQSDGRQAEKFEYDSEDGAKLTVGVRAKTRNGVCPITPSDLRMKIAAPAFLVGPSLEDSSGCYVGWQTVLNPIHGGLEPVEIGLTFHPKWLAQPKYLVLSMTVNVLTPEPFFSTQSIITTLAAALFAYLVELLPRGPRSGRIDSDS